MAYGRVGERRVGVVSGGAGLSAAVPAPARIRAAGATRRASRRPSRTSLSGFCVVLRQLCVFCHVQVTRTHTEPGWVWGV